MAKNQLFKLIPDNSFIIKLLNLYGIVGFEDTRFFTKFDLEKLNTLEKLKEIDKEIYSYYLPCKAKIYLKNITIKRCIVILRHFLKINKYTLFSKEKFINGKKTTIYQLIYLNKGIIVNKPNEKKITLSFE